MLVSPTFTVKTLLSQAPNCLFVRHAHALGIFRLDIIFQVHSFNPASSVRNHEVDTHTARGELFPPRPPAFIQNEKPHRGPRTNTSLSKYNSHMFVSLERKMPSQVYATAAAMKAKGVRPDLQTYLYLVQAAAADCRSIDGVGILEDMLSFGIQPNAEFFNMLMNAGFLNFPLISMFSLLDSATDRRHRLTCGELSQACALTMYFPTPRPTTSSSDTLCKMVTSKSR